MRRFAAALTLALFCLGLALGTSLLADRQLSRWEALLQQTGQALQQQDTVRARELIDGLGRSLKKASPALGLFYRRDLISGLEADFGSLRAYLQPDPGSRAELQNALGRCRAQLSLLRHLALAVL